MESNTVFCKELEGILFSYERVTALINMLYSLVSVGPIDIIGVEENMVEYSLYEIGERMDELNQNLQKFICNERTIEDKQTME